MSDNSAIEWTDASWNPIAGCTPVSPGCTHCYAATMARRLDGMGKAKYAGTAIRRGSVDVFTGKVNLDEAALTMPLRWKKPKRIFVNSMSDLFHEAVPFEFIDRVFATMAQANKHVYQILTKRPERMLEYLGDTTVRCYSIARALHADDPGEVGRSAGELLVRWPMKHVWLGTSVEGQKRADERIPHLLECPAAVRFLSIEPLLGPVVLRPEWLAQIQWVIVGGESGVHARSMHPDWARSLREQCAAAGVPFFFKQWGGRNKKAAGRLLDGVEHNGFPGEKP